MENINRVDIYVGEVGVAYVDKETAKKRLEAAEKNIQDMREILTSATTTKEKAESAYANANDALMEAQRVASELNSKIAEFETSNPVEENETSNPKYDLLLKLRSDLETNDFDNIGLNGGSEHTAQLNADELNSQIQKAQAIIDEATEYLSEEGRLAQLKNQYQEEYNNAVAAFEEYLPEEYEDDDVVSDEIERDLIERINAVNVAVENAQNITNAINNTSSEVSTRIIEIMGETVTITLVIENGYVENASQSITVNKGDHASWTVYANDGYKLPDTVTNGQIDGNQVTSNNTDDNLEVRVICVKIDEEPIDGSYYWYVGNADDPIPTSISPIVTDNTSVGWRLIGPSLESGQQIWSETYEIQIATENKVYQRIIINSDNVNLVFYDSLGNVAEFVNEKEIINGWTVYTTISKSKTFGIITKIQ